LDVLGPYLAGLAAAVCIGLGWCLRHSHLDGQPVGPLRRVFRLRRVLPLLCGLLAAGWSVSFWAIYLTPGPYKALVPIIGLIGFAIFVPLWNRRLRRLQEREWPT
jgi:hypothetical protein